MPLKKVEHIRKWAKSFVLVDFGDKLIKVLWKVWNDGHNLVVFDFADLRYNFLLLNNDRNDSLKWNE